MAAPYSTLWEGRGGRRPSAGWRNPSAGFFALALFALAVLPGMAGAQLTGAVCGRIPFCNACLAKRVGSVTRLFCTGCNTGYAAAPDQRSCFCAPGFWWDDVAGSCVPCGVGAW